MGMMEVNMPILYGEGIERAFERLQLEIIRREHDHSIFCWTGVQNIQNILHRPWPFKEGPLAFHPHCFASHGEDIQIHMPIWKYLRNIPYQMTNAGLMISLPVLKREDVVDLHKKGGETAVIREVITVGLSCQRTGHPGKAICLRLMKCHVPDLEGIPLGPSRYHRVHVNDTGGWEVLMDVEEILGANVEKIIISKSWA
jgi:hypothetical protein